MYRHASDESLANGLSNYCARELSLLDDEPPEAFDALARLAARLFDVPVALVSIVEEENDRQYFTGMKGLPHPWSTARQTPLSHSFCQYVKSENAAFVVENARLHPLVRENPAIEDLGVSAYLGVPIKSPGGDPIGALCVIQDKKRAWTDAEVALLEDLAICVNDEILLRASLLANEKAREQVQRFSALRESVALAFMAPDLSVEDRFMELLCAGSKALGTDTGAIAKRFGGFDDVLFCNRHLSGPECQCLAKNQPSLSSIVVSGQELVYFQDLALSNAKGRQNLHGDIPGAYIAAPLVVDGLMFGVIEFSAQEARAEPWSEEALNVMSIISLFANAHLEVYSEVRKAKTLEASLADLCRRGGSPWLAEAG